MVMISVFILSLRPCPDPRFDQTLAILDFGFRGTGDEDEEDEEEDDPGLS